MSLLLLLLLLFLLFLPSVFMLGLMVMVVVFTLADYHLILARPKQPA